MRAEAAGKAGEKPRGPEPDRAAPARLAVVLLLGIAAGYLLALFLWPFLPAVLTSVVLALLFSPAHRRLERLLGRKSLAAFLATVAIFFLILIPLLGISLLLAARLEVSLAWVAHEAGALVQPGGRVAGWSRAVAARLGVEPAALLDTLRQEAQGWIGHLAGRTLRLLSGIGGWVLQAGVALFTLYYLLRDSRGILAAVRWLLPFPPAATDALFERAHAVALATVYGNVVTAAIQGIAGGLVFWALGLPAPLLWGTVMSFLGLLPIIGPPVVWLPAGLALLVSGSPLKGVLLLLLGFLVISGIDNLVRPLLVGGRAQLHPLVVFFSVLGGVYVLGAVGLVVGPVLFVVALTVIEMARAALEPSALPRGADGVGILLHQPTDGSSPA